MHRLAEQMRRFGPLALRPAMSVAAQLGAARGEALLGPESMRPAQMAKVPGKSPAVLDALIKAASAEGELTIYYAMSESIVRRINDAFTGKYGLKTQSLRIVLLQQRCAGEMSSNAVAALVQISPWSIGYSTAKLRAPKCRRTGPYDDKNLPRENVSPSLADQSRAPVEGAAGPG